MTGYDLVDFCTMMVHSSSNPQAEKVFPRDIFFPGSFRTKKIIRINLGNNRVPPLQKARVLQTFSKSILSDKEKTYSLHHRLHHFSCPGQGLEPKSSHREKETTQTMMKSFIPVKKTGDII